MGAVAGAAVVWSAPIVRSVRLDHTAGTPAPQETSSVVVVTEPTTEPTTAPTTEPADTCRAELRLKGAYDLERSYDLAEVTFEPDAAAPMTVGARNASGSGRFELLMSRVSDSTNSAFKGMLRVDLADGAPTTFRISGHWDDDAMTLQGSAVAAKGTSLRLRFVCS
jgi:hypothetical protein